MKKFVIVLLTAFLVVSSYSQGYYNNKKFDYNPCRKEPDKKLILSLAVKTIGFGIMSYANYRQRQSIEYPTNFKISNEKLHTTGLSIFALSLKFDIDIVRRENKLEKRNLYASRKKIILKYN